MQEDKLIRAMPSPEPPNTGANNKLVHRKGVNGCGMDGQTPERNFQNPHVAHLGNFNMEFKARQIRPMPKISFVRWNNAKGVSLAKHDRRENESFVRHGEKYLPLSSSLGSTATSGHVWTEGRNPTRRRAMGPASDNSSDGYVETPKNYFDFGDQQLRSKMWLKVSEFRFPLKSARDPMVQRIMSGNISYWNCLVQLRDAVSWLAIENDVHFTKMVCV